MLLSVEYKGYYESKLRGFLREQNEMLFLARKLGKRRAEFTKKIIFRYTILCIVNE